MKSHTNLEQSKNLAEILPIESADMSYQAYREEGGISDYQATLCPHRFASWIGIPCWSLAALLEILPFHLIANNRSYAFSMVKGLNKDGETYAIKYAIFNTTFYLHLTDFYNNPVDACVEIILKLHEQNLL